jgi:hypothetical protein
VGTFRALADFADFTKTETVPVAQAEPAAQMTFPRQQAASTGGMTVNLNIELALPADESGKVYDAFFRSMKKHLMSPLDE